VKFKVTNGWIEIDAEDIVYVSQYTWSIQNNKDGQYVKRSIGKKSILLHRDLLNNPIGLEVDHLDHNGLNNKRDNLRVCTSSQNKQNMRVRRDNKLGIKGVYYNKKERKYYAQIKLEKRIWLGSYNTAEEANAAYQKAANKLFKEFACY